MAPCRLAPPHHSRPGEKPWRRQAPGPARPPPRNTTAHRRFPQLLACHHSSLWVFPPPYFFLKPFFLLFPSTQGAMQWSLGEGGGGCAVLQCHPGCQSDSPRQGKMHRPVPPSLCCPHVIPPSLCCPHVPVAAGRSWSPSPARWPLRSGCGKTEAQRGL